MSLAILISSWMHFQVFVPADRPYSVQPISDELLQKFDTAPPVVATGLVITRFLTFNVAANKFVFEGTLWFYFDPAQIDEKIIEAITFENGSFLEKSAPYTQLINAKKFVRYAVRVKLQTQLNYRAFPDDDHALALIMLHKGASVSNMLFTVARPDFIIQDELAREGWSIFDRNTQSGYVESRIHSAQGNFTTLQPAVAFGIDIRRTSMREFITILFPMLIMLIMSLCTFSVSGAPERLNLTLSSIAGIVAFRFVMDSVSPKVPYFMLSDYLFLLFLSAYVFLFFMNLISTRLSLPWLKILIVGSTSFVAGSCILLWTYF